MRCNSPSPLRSSQGRLFWLSARLRLGDLLPKADAATSRRTCAARIDQFDSRTIERGNQLHERIHIGADDAIAGFHALNGGNGKVGQVGHLPLIYIQERTSGPELIGGDHERGFSDAGGIQLQGIKFGFNHQFRLKIYHEESRSDQQHELTPMAVSATNASILISRCT